MSELKTSQTDLDAYEVINNLPENNIKKYSIVILDLLKKITKKSPKCGGVILLLVLAITPILERIVKQNISGLTSALHQEKIKLLYI